MKRKNLIKKLYASLIMVLFAAISLGTSTYAWFSMNSKVEVTGMQVTATAEGNLVVNKEALVPAGYSESVAEFDGTKYILKPMTWDSAWKVPADYETVDQKTGSPETALVTIESTAWKESTISGTTVVPGYYKDYLVYVASAGEELTGKDLQVHFDLGAITETTEMFHKALAVAFYVDNAAPTQTDTPTDEVLLTEFYTISGKEWTQIASTEDSYYVTIESDVTIPSCQEEDAGLAITIRVYFDGKVSGTEDTYNQTEVTAETFVADTYYKLAGGKYTLMDAYSAEVKNYFVKSTATVAYINSANLPTDQIDLAITFRVEEPAA